MGGGVGCESAPGVGSTFWFTARLKKCTEYIVPQPGVVVEAEKTLRERYAGYRVLVVDDEPINLEIAQALLEEVGLSVDTAENGAKAIAMAQANAYSVILMDMQMPEIDGLSATRSLRDEPTYKTTPIIAMTANAFAEDKARCFEAGMNDFLTKPTEPDKLYAILVKWLGSSAA